MEAFSSFLYEGNHYMNRVEAARKPDFENRVRT